METFTKYDSDKPDWSLLDLSLLEGLVKVLDMGVKKYEKDNWKKCEDISRYKAALLRHLTEMDKGNELDEESSLSHIDHAMCNLLFLKYFELNKPK